MKLAVNLIHDGAVELARTAEALGYDLALAPEGYRSDAPSVLGAVAATTHRIGLASGVMQVPARTPALTALTAATLDELSGGRFRLGLGVSQPAVSEGWYGEPFDRPLGRTREYVEIVRAALRRETVHHDGRHYRLPASETGASAPLRLTTEPVRPDLPIYLAAVGPANLALAGEIADGWIGMFTAPARVAEAVSVIDRARARAGRTGEFEVMPCAPVAVDTDVSRAADALRAHVGHLLALGTRDRNVYCALATEMGFGAAVDRVHEHKSRGDFAGMAAAVPFEFIDQTALLGPVPRIADRLAEYAAAGATTMGIMVSSASTSRPGRLRILRDVADAVG